MVKRLLKIVLFLALFFAFGSIIMLLFFLLSKSFNITCVRIMSSLLCILGLLFVVGWNLYIDDVEYKHLSRYQTENGCYKAAKPLLSIRGIVIFCTNCNEPHLRRYIDYHTELGFNKEKKHWNYPHNIDMPHEFIGYNKNEEIVIINTIPYGYSCFLNENTHSSVLDGYIKIYICREDSQNMDYFNNVVGGALVNLCSKLCKKYKLRPNDIILDAQSNDSINNICSEWFSQNQYSINQLRFDVKSRNTPIMLFAEDYFNVLRWFENLFKK